jgi:hypothetical protein
MNRHIWEGWTVQDFINEIEPTFDRIMENGREFGNDPFTDDKKLKEWVKSNQPYYKKHIPEVYKYFRLRRQQWKQ